MQDVMFKPESDWKPTPVSELPSWEGAKRVGLDVETCDPQLLTLGAGVRRDGRLVGISFAIEDGPAHYLPFGHSDDNLAEEACLDYIRDQIREYKGIIVGANLQYDLDYLLHCGVVFHSEVSFRDIQVAEPLLDEHQFSYSLDNIAARYDMSGKDEDLLIEAALAYGLDPKEDLWQIPARYVGRYAAQDARLPLTLLRRQERRIDDENLWQVYNLECKLTPILVEMTRRGVRIDTARLNWIADWATKQEKAYLKIIKSHTGRSLAPGESSTTSIMAGILRQEGIKVPKTVPKKETSSPQDSVTSNFLKILQLPWADAAVRARAFDKLRTTFVSSISRYMCNGRIHMEYNQLRRTKDGGGGAGAITGRLSSSDPNIQQQPSRDREIAPVWRSIYLPEEGAMWRSADFSSQEPRLAVHFAESARVSGVQDFAERYRTDPGMDFHAETARAVHIERKPAKQIGLGKMYGMGGAKFCRELGLPVASKSFERNGKTISYIGAGTEGQRLMDAFDAGVPFLKELVRKVKNAAKRRGYVITILGGRQRFEKDAKGKYYGLHKALNKLIQSSAAYQMKQAMVNAAEAGFYPPLQVHDELNDTAANGDDDGNVLKEIMENAITLSVPSRVKVSVGPNWGEAK